jgi:hypothetical protein
MDFAQDDNFWGGVGSGATASGAEREREQAEDVCSRFFGGN